MHMFSELVRIMGWSLGLGLCAALLMPVSLLAISLGVICFAGLPIIVLPRTVRATLTYLIMTLLGVVIGYGLLTSLPERFFAYYDRAEDRAVWSWDSSTILSVEILCFLIALLSMWFMRKKIPFVREFGVFTPDS